MTKQQAGRLGGRSTYKRHGRQHMQTIGRKGAEQFHKLYHLSPLGNMDFAVVRRADNIIVSFTNSSTWR